jgi:hypothetical protein
VVSEGGGRRTRDPAGSRRGTNHPRPCSYLTHCPEQPPRTDTGSRFAAARPDTRCRDRGGPDGEVFIAGGPCFLAQGLVSAAALTAMSQSSSAADSLSLL